MRPRKSSKAKWLIPAGVLLLGGLAVIAWSLVPSFVWRTVQREADRRGVSLKTCALDIGWSALAVTRCEFRLSTFPEITGTIDRVDVTLAGLKPQSITVTGAHVRVAGVPRFQDLAYRVRPTAGDGVPFVLRQSDLTWTLGAGASPWLTLSELGYTAASGAIAAEATALDRFHGKLSGTAEALSLGLLSAASPGSDLNFRSQQTRDWLSLVLEFRQLPLGQLEGSALDFPPELESVRADGRLNVRIPAGLTAETPAGDVRVVLTGINFPVPRELEGLVYGTPAELSANLSIARNLQRSELERVSFVIGELNMRGRGRLELADAGLAFQLNLSGDLGCNVIARSATAAHKNSPLWKAAGRVAQRSLKGQVQISSSLEGNSRRLGDARVLTTAGVGCGVTPLPIGDLLKAPLELLEQLPKSAPALPTFELPKPDGARSKVTSQLGGASAASPAATALSPTAR